MLRRLHGLGLTTLLVACGSVSNESRDAAQGDGRSTDTLTSVDVPPGAHSIVSVHHVLEMRPATQTLSGSVSTGSGKVLIIASGSGQCTSGFSIGMAIKVDGTAIGTSRSATNEFSSSKAFVRNVLVADVTAGSHTFSVEPLAGTTMNASDFVDLTVVELGTAATATTIFDDVAPPYSQSFATTTGQGLLFVGGSGFASSTATPGTIGMDVQLDTQSVGSLKTYTNELSSHKTLAAAHMVLTLAAATRTMTLPALSNTTIDYNDRASALWLHLGSDATLTSVMDATIGPLPASNTFTSSGRQVMVIVSGSGFRSAGNGAGLVEIPVQLDSVTIGSMKATTVETSSHKQAIPTVLLAQPAAGAHTVTLTAATGTSTDFNDRFNVTVIELGP